MVYRQGETIIIGCIDVSNVLNRLDFSNNRITCKVMDEEGIIKHQIPPEDVTLGADRCFAFIIHGSVTSKMRGKYYLSVEFIDSYGIARDMIDIGTVEIVKR